MSKLRLYISTALHLKPSQIAYRVWRKVGGKTRLRLGHLPLPDPNAATISRIPVMPELEFDLAFLSRFDVDSIMENRIELLHHEEAVDWSASWHEPLSTPLWRFNLHYCEYLLPLAKAYLDTGDTRYLDKGKAIIRSWIGSCPRARGGAAWDPYVISMRIVNWLAFYGELHVDLDRDSEFVGAFNQSLAEQFVHLSQHLEKDLLANHYLENLKALVILSCYFGDERMLDLVLPKLYGQVGEQILPDGMHFELSPMYHKIVLEDLLRVATCLAAHGREADEVAKRLRLQDMCDCLWSLERNTDRTPLFNDSGDNVAKSRDAILRCARKQFDIDPVCRDSLPDAGYYVLERQTEGGMVKVIFDAGMPGPEYALGHAHCDALSFEAFLDGAPIVVNGGTFAYQDEARLSYKRTEAHSTTQVLGVEQSECWAPFRMAEHSRCKGRLLAGFRFEGTMVDQKGNRITRTAELDEKGVLTVEDSVEPTCRIVSRVNLLKRVMSPEVQSARYSPEFGMEHRAVRFEKTERGSVSTKVDLVSKSVA